MCEGFSASEEIPVLSGKLTTVASQINRALPSPASLQGDLSKADLIQIFPSSLEAPKLSPLPHSR